MKKILLVLGCVVVTVLLLGIGWFAGFQSKFLAKSMSVNIVDKALVDLSVNRAQLRQIEDGEIDELKQSLQMEMAVNIVTIDGLLDYSDDRGRNFAQKIFTRISNDWAKSPPQYPTNLSQANLTSITSRVDSILKRASEPKK